MCFIHEMRYDHRRFLLLVMISVVFIIFCSKYTRISTLKISGDVPVVFNDDMQYEKMHRLRIDTYYSKRKNWNTSNLGSILFKNDDPKRFQRTDAENKTFVVLFWKHWDWLKPRHLYNFGVYKKGNTQVLDDCSVKNCIFTGDDKYMDSADALVIHMQKKQVPNMKGRNPKQRWIFLNDESPINKFSLATNSRLSWKKMSNMFHWTMTYRSDSDIPVPYGRTVPLSHPQIINSNASSTLNKLVPYWKDKILNNRTMIIISNCMDMRMKLIQKLQTYIKVDVFGGCANKPENKKKCPGHFKEDCMLPTEYLFYLVLENSKCKQYITEKVFQHAYSKGAIPVIFGPTIQDAEDLLPPNSFLHVEKYKRIKKLAKHMTDIARSPSKILQFHSWRKDFAIANEHGYFKSKSYHLCRVCEALNYNNAAMKTYSANELKSYFNERLLCDLSYGTRKIFEKVSEYNKEPEIKWSMTISSA